MKKGYVILIVLLLCLESAIGQTKKQLVKKRKNPFEMVHVDDSVRKKLYLFLSEKDQNAINAGMSIYHVLGEDKANNYQFVEGIYSFRLMGPHFPVYYFVYTKKDGIQIIKDYTVEGLLTELMASFKRNEVSFNERKKITYLEAMLHSLNSRNDLNGDSEALKIHKKTP